MSVYLVPVIPMQHATTVLVALHVLVIVAILEMDFSVQVSKYQKP